MSIIMACFTGISALIAFEIPGYPVPFTCQTFAALTSGLILGKKYGALSQTIYLLLGITCIPWLCCGSGGDISVLNAPCIGYDFGFILISYLAGYAPENTANRKFKRILIITILASFAVYIPGLGCLTLRALPENILTLQDVLIKGLIIFIPGDILKALAAASIYKTLLPKN